MFQINLIHFDREKLFRHALLFSIALHGLFFSGLYLKNFLESLSPAPTLEIDLTKPFRIGGNPLLKPGGGTSLKARGAEKPFVTPMEEKPAAVPAPEKKAALKEWVLPNEKTKELEKPAPETASQGAGPVNPQGTEEGAFGTGGGVGGGEGEGGGIPLTRLPQLLNRSEIMRMIKKLYPYEERAAGHEGDVFVDIHIGADGRVSGVEVIESAGNAFDQAAKTVAVKMRFSPAMVQTTAVAVKIRQAIAFRLEDAE